VATRWKPGQSGNPNGRPKGSRNISAVLRDVLRQKVAVTENGKTRQLPVLEAMVRRLVNEALRNQPTAMKLLLSMIDRYADAPQSESRLEELQAEDQRILARYLELDSGQTKEPDAKGSHEA
jgi:hypothetical protein